MTLADLSIYTPEINTFRKINILLTTLHPEYLSTGLSGYDFFGLSYRDFGPFPPLNEDGPSALLARYITIAQDTAVAQGLPAAAAVSSNIDFDGDVWLKDKVKIYSTKELPGGREMALLGLFDPEYLAHTYLQRRVLPYERAIEVSNVSLDTVQQILVARSLAPWPSMTSSPGPISIHNQVLFVPPWCDTPGVCLFVC